MSNTDNSIEPSSAPVEPLRALGASGATGGAGAAEAETTGPEGRGRGGTGVSTTVGGGLTAMASGEGGRAGEEPAEGPAKEEGNEDSSGDDERRWAAFK